MEKKCIAPTTTTSWYFKMTETSLCTKATVSCGKQPLGERVLHPTGIVSVQDVAQEMERN